MRDEVDDELEAALKGHFDAEGLAKGANAAVDGIELPKTGEMRMPEMDIRPESERVMQMPEMDLRPEADGPRPGSIKAQVGAAVTGGAKAPARPAPARDTELEGLQADAKKRRSFSQLGQAVADFTERPTNLLDYAQRLGGGGVSQAPKTKMWQENAAEGDRAIEDLATRRKSEAGMETQQATRAASADDNDANGQTAQTYRSVLVKFAPELSEKLATATPKQMRAIAPWLEKFAMENNDLLQAKAKAEADAKAREEAKAARAADVERSQKNADRSYEASMANARATQGLASASLGVRKAEVEKKAADDVKDDVKDLAKQLPGDLADFESKYARVKAAIDANPNDIPGVGKWDANVPSFVPEALGGPGKADLDVQKDAGQMLAAYQKLITGAGASDDERKMLAKISLDLNNEKSFASGLESLREAYTAKVKQVRTGFATPVLQQYDKNANREGLGAKTGGKVRVSNGSETLEIDAADLAEAERDGFKAVK